LSVGLLLSVPIAKSINSARSGCFASVAWIFSVGRDEEINIFIPLSRRVDKTVSISGKGSMG
jgi:hypothetical protein